MANLFGYNITYNARDEDFLQVGETRGSGNRTSSFTATTNFDLHRFFMGTGIVMPINFSMSGNRAQPRYTAGDDVVRTGAIAQASESRSDIRSYGISYSRTWSERSNPFLRYTLGGISASMNRSTSETSNPASVDTSRTTSAGVGYTISPRRLLPVGLPGTRFRVWPLPERFYWNYAVSTRSSRIYDRRRDAEGSLVLRNASYGRSASIDFGRHPAVRPPAAPVPGQAQSPPAHEPPRAGRLHQLRTGGAVEPVVQLPLLRASGELGASAAQLEQQLLPEQRSRAVVGSQHPLGQQRGGLHGQLVPAVRPAGDSAALGGARLGQSPAAGLEGLARIWGRCRSMPASIAAATTRADGTLSLRYLVGLSDDPGLSADSTGRVRPSFGNAIQKTQDWRTGGRTRLTLGRGASIQTNADLTVRRSEYNNLVNRVRRIQFPNFDVDYGKLPEAIGLKRVFVNPKLRSVYSRSRTTEFSNSTSPTNISTSTEWRPLIGLTGDLKNGTRAEFRIQHRGTEAQYRQVGSSTTTDANTDVDLSLSRSYSRGQKVSFLGKANTVKTNITLGLTGTYSRRKSETRQAGLDRPFNQASEDRLNVNARGSYGFSTNVTGNAELGFSQQRNLQTDIVTRSVRVELRAQFTF
jgi:hypothetical protein